MAPYDYRTPRERDLAQDIKTAWETKTPAKDAARLLSRVFRSWVSVPTVQWCYRELDSQAKGNPPFRAPKIWDWEKLQA